MPKLGAPSKEDPEFTFVSIDGSDLIFRGPNHELVKASDVPKPKPKREPKVEKNLATELGFENDDAGSDENADLGE